MECRNIINITLRDLVLTQINISLSGVSSNFCQNSIDYSFYKPGKYIDIDVIVIIL